MPINTDQACSAIRRAWKVQSCRSHRFRSDGMLPAGCQSYPRRLSRPYPDRFWQWAPRSFLCHAGVDPTTRIPVAGRRSHRDPRIITAQTVANANDTYLTGQQAAEFASDVVGHGCHGDSIVHGRASVLSCFFGNPPCQQGQHAGDEAKYDIMHAVRLPGGIWDIEYVDGRHAGRSRPPS